MAKIVMWGVTTTGTKEQKSKLESLQNKFDSLNLQFGNNKQPNVLADCVVLLKHDSDIPANQNLNSVQWTVICSGSVTEPKVNEANKTAGIPPSILIENLGNFLEATKTQSQITKQHIELLFAIDPKVEGLLEKLSVVVPFEDLWESALRNTKHDLQKEIKKKLA